MAQITIRGIDPEIEKEIRKKAMESGQSLNNVVLDIIQNNMGKKKKRFRNGNSLKALAGGWHKKDASQFLDSIKIFEQIDEDMWK
ncbi:MAG: hypothetical protein GX654_17740 [Desulfatiglans sp.]|jgi:plasmid stability protein|nr:hypothetical protein [Desulfatiglans sp.]